MHGKRTFCTEVNVQRERRFVKTDGGLASGGQNASAGITRSRETAGNDVTNAISQE